MTTLTTETGPFACACGQTIHRDQTTGNGWRDEYGDLWCEIRTVPHAPAVETDPREVLIVTDADSEPAPAVKTPAAPWNLPFILRADDETWTLGDSDGRTVVIARRGADVFVVDSGGALRFEGVKRDLFARCFDAAATAAGTENGQ